MSKNKIKQLEISGPLYTEADAQGALELLQPVPFEQPYMYRGFSFTYFWAGHILGAAHVRVEFENKSILFSGDIGPVKPILHKGRKEPPPADYVIMESTYGSNFHKKEDHQKAMIKAVRRVISKKGMLVIPAFAIGRSQLVLYVFYK